MTSKVSYERQGRLTRTTARRIEALTDEQMQRIAEETAEGLTESFWDALEVALDHHRAKQPGKKTGRTSS